MANLDLSELMYDDDLAGETFTVQRISRVVDDTGMSADQSYFSDGTGAVQPATPRQLEQLAEADRASAGIAIYTQFPLVVQTDTQAADIVIWQGKHYRTAQVTDWSNYGAGFVMAIATLIDLAADQPSTSVQT